MSNQTNPYLGLPKRDLAILRRSHKKNPDTLKNIEDAIAALTPYHAGRLDKDQMSLVASVVEKATLADPADSRAADALLVLRDFHGPAPAPKPRKASAPAGVPG